MEGVLEDEEEEGELTFGADDEDGPDDDDEWLPAPAPAPAAAARGRGGTGKGGRGRGGGRGGTGRRALAEAGRRLRVRLRWLLHQAPAPTPAAQSKYRWKDVAGYAFTPRVKYAGEELPVLSELFDGLTSKSRPYEFFEILDAPDNEYSTRAINSEKYRAYRIANEMDGVGKDGHAKHSYGDAGVVTHVRGHAAARCRHPTQRPRPGGLACEAILKGRPRPPLSSVEQQQPSGRRPEGRAATPTHPRRLALAHRMAKCLHIFGPTH